MRRDSERKPAKSELKPRRNEENEENRRDRVEIIIFFVSSWFKHLRRCGAIQKENRLNQNSNHEEMKRTKKTEEIGSKSFFSSFLRGLNICADAARFRKKTG